MSTPAESSSSKPASSSKATNAGNEDFEKLLNREARAFERQMEVERILKAFKLNPYDLLDLDETATQEDIKRKYRQLSLFIHPDKAQHERAPEAFDLLKKAESELSDKDKREELDAVIKEARNIVLKALNLPLTTEESDPRLLDIVPPYKLRVRLQTKELLIDEEVRRRKAVKMSLANEGLEAKKKEEEVASKKRKAEEDRVWEDTREQRVGNWRQFSKESTKKKKKAKIAILG